MDINIKNLPDILLQKKLVLIQTNDPYTNLKCGDTGIIDYVDSTGTIFVKWENGTRLGVIPGIDKFAIFFV